MIKDKILVFSNYQLQKNSGGPSGYIYKCMLGNLPSNMTLLQDELEKNNGKFRVRLKNKISYLASLFYNNKRNHHVIKFIKSNSFNYKYLYFHDVFTLHSVLHLISKNQIIILQSHSPELPSQELFQINKNQIELEKNSLIEKKSFNRADVLIFPNKECTSLYQDLIDEKHNIKYLLTGIKEIKSNVEYPIKENKINILYIGRRNEIKGYHTLIETFKKATKKRNDLRLFVAGGGEEIQHENIFDIGSVSTAYDWVNSVDFVVSLNKQSYFDLNVIECICLGTPLIMTTTEGHQFFKNKKGIIDVTKYNLLDVLLDVNLVSKNFKKENKLNIVDIYNQFFTADKYRDSLFNISNEVIYYN